MVNIETTGKKTPESKATKATRAFIKIRQFFVVLDLDSMEISKTIKGEGANQTEVVFKSRAPFDLKSHQGYMTSGLEYSDLVKISKVYEQLKWGYITPEKSVFLF